VLLPQLSAQQLHKFALRGFERRYPDAALIGDPQVIDDLERNSIAVIVRFKAGNASIAQQQEWLVPFSPVNFGGAFRMPDVLKRTQPMGVPTHPYEAHYSLEVLWPDNVSALRDPFTRRIDNKYFSFHAKGSFRGNRSKYELRLATRSDVIDAADVRQALDDIRKVDNMARGSAFLTRSDVREVIRFSRRNLQDTIRARLQESVERSSQTIGAGRLIGADLAEALCTRAEAFADLGKNEEALRDGNEAVRTAASLPRAYECRANVSFYAGQFQQAVMDYSKALTLGNRSFDSFYRRGRARLYLGKLEEAAEDFAKALEDSADAENSVYVELWLASTLKRLQRPVPAALVERARQEARGAWPRPALAMLVDALPPEEMLKEVERLKGDEREMALTEAWFYVGQSQLARKQLPAAREAFGKAREKGIIIYVEHVAAGFELRQMESAATGASAPVKSTAN
jgi:lipoprotein NlpI